MHPETSEKEIKSPAHNLSEAVAKDGSKKSSHCFETIKPGFHYPSSRPELTGVKKRTQVGPSSRPVNSGRELGYSGNRLYAVTSRNSKIPDYATAPTWPCPWTPLRSPDLLQLPGAAPVRISSGCGSGSTSI